MLNLSLGKLLSAHTMLSSFNQTTNGRIEITVSADNYRDLRQNAAAMIEACDRINLLVTKVAVSLLDQEFERAEQISDTFAWRGNRFARMKGHLDGAIRCLHYESPLKNALILPPGMEDYYEPSSPLFGIEVQNRFPAATYEIEEAGKCVAVGRSTAAVFHLMRVMECGIYAVARCLGITDPVRGSDKNWGRILQKIHDERLSRNASATRGWTNLDDKAYFDGAYATLDAVRNAWRNTTMHVENKYSGEEALHIFVAVRAFMMKLASRMDQDGQPLA